MVAIGKRWTLLFWMVLAGAFVGVALFFRWLMRWRDPQWDSEEKQSRSFLWSSKGGGGGFGV
ncbi:MAG: hypothetical protein ABR613_03790 [Actinomycetota bacterium]